jgi:two-component system, OmpR family, alkaline phosphatase synthesis response regulator PhoP
MTPDVLICDDEPHITRAIAVKLSRADYSVRAVNDGDAAWESIQLIKPGLLVTDLQMPRMNGLELARRIRSTPQLADLPIILLTAKALELDSAEIAELKFLKVLGKPFSPREILDLTNQTLGEPLICHVHQPTPRVNWLEAMPVRPVVAAAAAWSASIR